MSVGPADSAIDAASIDVPETLAECGRRLGAASSTDLGYAVAVAERLTPPRWSLEWYLPVWLCSAFGLEGALARELVLSNLLGLVSVRLRDDLADGDVAFLDRERAERVAGIAFEEALRPYRSRFEMASPFWPRLDGWMTEWAASHASPDLHAPSRGAPLKVSGFAICVLADRMDAWRALEFCLDQALTALVLYDQFLDWEADLGAGRWNAFVAATSAHEQRAENLERNRASVLAAMLARGATSDHFARVRAAATEAAALAERLGVSGLHAHLSQYAITTARQGAEIEAQYVRTAEQARQLLFGGAPAAAN
jgi:hypothetical protein